jgi:hypothetical protein
MTRLNPITTPRFEARAETARRSETGSATGSRNRSNALNAFTARKAEIDARLARLQALSDDHFNAHPDEVGWADVIRHFERATGAFNLADARPLLILEHYASLLKRIADSAFGEGEHAR